MESDDIKNFPVSPGVYLMKNIRKNIIYVGKAMNPRKPVVSYFTKMKLDLTTEVLINKIHDYRSLSVVRERLAYYFDFYNTERPHASLEYQTPQGFYYEFSSAQKAAFANR